MEAVRVILALAVATAAASAAPQQGAVAKEGDHHHHYSCTVHVNPASKVHGYKVIPDVSAICYWVLSKISRMQGHPACMVNF